MPGRLNIAPMPDDYFVPDRFSGRTVIVTGCARGMGRGAAWRLAREGANVVGADWLEKEGLCTVEEIATACHATRCVAGDVAEDVTCARMVEVAVTAFGGVDVALHNAGVMDGVHSGEANAADSCVEGKPRENEDTDATLQKCIGSKLRACRSRFLRNPEGS